MTDTERELSNKALHAQMLARQAIDLIEGLLSEICAQRLRIDTLDTVVQGMAIGRSPRDAAKNKEGGL